MHVAIRKAYVLRVGLVLVMVTLLGGGIFYIFHHDMPSLTTTDQETVKRPLENVQVRPGLPPEKTFLGKMSSEKAGTIRVQVRGVVKQWGDGILDLSINGNESIRVKLPSQVQYACSPSLMERMDGECERVDLSCPYNNLASSVVLGEINPDDDKSRTKSYI